MNFFKKNVDKRKVVSNKSILIYKMNNKFLERFFLTMHSRYSTLNKQNLNYNTLL